MTARSMVAAPETAELDLLLRAADAVLQAATCEADVLEVATKLLAQHLGYGSCGVLLHDEAAGELFVATAAGAMASDTAARSARLKLGHGLIGTAVLERRTLNVADMRAEARASAQHPDVISLLCAPMVVRDELLGAVAAARPTVSAFSSRDERLLIAIAHIVALALMHARTHEGRRADLETIRAQFLELGVVHEVAERAAALDLDGTLQTAVGTFQRLTTADSTAIYLWSPADDALAIAALRFDPRLYPPDYEERVRAQLLKLGEGLVGWTAKAREPLLIPDVAKDGRARPITGIPLEGKSAILVPIVAEQHLLGVIRAVKMGVASFSEEHFRLAKTLANSAALAIAAARAHQEQDQRIRELAAIHEVTQHAATGDLEATLRAAVEALRSLIDADSAGVWNWNQERDVLEPAALSVSEGAYPAAYVRWLRERTFRLGEGLMGLTALGREPILAADISTDPRAVSQEEVPAGPRTGVYAPLVAEGQLVGVLRGTRIGTRSFSQEHLRLATTLANAVALAVAAARAHRQQARRIAELAALHRSSLALAEAMTVEQSMAALLRGAIEVTRAEAGLIWRRTGEGFVLAAAQGIDAAAVSAYPPDARASLSAEMLATGRPFVLPDLHAEPGRPNWKPAVPELHSLLGVPLRSEGVLYGSLQVLHRETDRFRQADARHLEVLAAHATAVLGRAQAFEEARRAAITDELTGCFNARHFGTRLDEELKRAIRYERPLSLIMFDSDSLKLVNDRFGHEEGNRHIVELASAIREHVRGTDIVARFGGDEFLVLQPETEQEQATTTAERIRETIQGRSFTSSRGEPFAVSVSAGVASFPASSTDAEDLFRQVDLALYAAKRRGKNCVALAPPRRAD